MFKNSRMILNLIVKQQKKQIFLSPGCEIVLPNYRQEYEINQKYKTMLPSSGSIFLCFKTIKVIKGFVSCNVFLYKDELRFNDGISQRIVIKERLKYFI